MIGYYKKHILALSEAISQIQVSPERVDQLEEFQNLLIRRIMHSEKKIDDIKMRLNELKHKLGTNGLTKEKAKKFKKKVKFYKKRIRDHKWMLFVWRCFGDAVVFLYLDKFAIKPFLYEFGSREQKQRAGRLAGKEGLKAELSVAFDVLAHGIPAILCDLTNCIRHGDICLLGGNDPFVIEIKSSANTNSRVKRQVEAISGLHQYLDTDQSNKLFGVQHLKRMELGVPELNYQASISQQISEAKVSGFCHQSPETGLHIFAISSVKMMDEFQEVMSGLDQPITFFLNEAKNNQAWGSYYPFVLSINQPEELYAFLKGDVYVIVVIEFGVCEALACEKGWKINYRETGDYAFEFTEVNTGEEEPIRFSLSHHFVGRIAHEFLSLQWVMDFQEHIQSGIELAVHE